MGWKKNFKNFYIYKNYPNFKEKIAYLKVFIK